MASHGKKRGLPVEHENEERWLLTYADMLTLLFALFMVLFSISSVNISKYQVLQQSLKAAFSGSILPGGRAILQSGSESTAAHTPATAAVPSIVPLQPTPTSESSDSTGSANAFTSAQQAASAQPMTSAQLQAALNSMSASIAEQDELVGLQHKLNAYAQAHGFGNQVKAIVNRRGLVVQVLTDNLLFQSGQATLQSAGLPLLNEVAQLLNVDRTHPITVEGYTDNIPIHSAEFPSNWELSTTRATTVVQYLISRGVNENRLGAAGYADLHPIASNATAAGRALNRRVDIVIERLNPEPPS
ncbi:MAG TPA: flagellar motor protein MotB [Solirubrobacteraceae bacterium]|nr:flagellar motor protein MotB [Solirubrobacteraceae bacterium]